MAISTQQKSEEARPWTAKPTFQQSNLKFVFAANKLAQTLTRGRRAAVAQIPRAMDGLQSKNKTTEINNHQPIRSFTV